MLNELYNKIKEQNRFDDIFKPASKEELYKRKKERIERVLRKQGCTLNPDGTYSCEGDVRLYGMKLTRLYVRFKEVGGNFDCSLNRLTILEGAPEIVGGNFNCNANELETLEGAPREVGKDFSCSYNKLTSLEGAPEKVGGDFICSYNNRLTSLKGAPREVGGDFTCFRSKLTSLEGAPEKVEGYVYIGGNPIAKRLGIDRIIKGSELHKYVK